MNSRDVDVDVVVVVVVDVVSVDTKHFFRLNQVNLFSFFDFFRSNFDFNSSSSGSPGKCMACFTLVVVVIAALFLVVLSPDLFYCHSIFEVIIA